MRFFLLLMLSAQAFGAPARHSLGGGGGLGSYGDLVVSDSPATRHSGVRVTYLGTNGYEFEFRGHALLVDPYFSRVDLLSVAAGTRIQPDISRIADGMRHLAPGNVWSSAFRRRDIAPESRVNAELQTSPKLDAILVTHGHFDHLLDVPIIMSKTHAHLIASRSSIDLVRRLPDAGPIAKRFDVVTAGDVRRIGPWKIRVLPATHDRLFGKVPFDRHEQRSADPPQRASDWICGEPLAFLIEINGQRIYIDSGGTPAQLPPKQPVDLAILGMALPDSRARLPAALERLQPRYVLPSHQDNFFLPLSDGFQFGPLTDFPRVQRDCAQQNRSRLILLDYFRPWTLPRQQVAAVSSKSQGPNPKECDHEFETRSFPNSLAATLATLPSVSLLPAAPLTDGTDIRNTVLPYAGGDVSDESDAKDASHSQSTACEMQLKRHHVLSRRSGTLGLRTRPRVAFAFFEI